MPTTCCFDATTTVSSPVIPLKLHLTTSGLWFGQEQEGILTQVEYRNLEYLLM